MCRLNKPDKALIKALMASSVVYTSRINSQRVCNLTTNLAACVSVCVSVPNLTNFCPHVLISTQNVPKILFA